MAKIYAVYIVAEVKAIVYSKILLSKIAGYLDKK
jgi:hypothetical protein